MSVFRNVVFVAALAGLVAAVVMTALRMFSTVPLILQAEVYEQAGDAAGHDHAAAPADQPAATGNMSTMAMAPEAAAPAHQHEEGAWEPADGLERYSFTA